MCDGEPEMMPPCWGGSDDTIDGAGAGLSNLVLVGMMEHLQSGHVEFDCSQLCMHSK